MKKNIIKVLIGLSLIIIMIGIFLIVFSKDSFGKVHYTNEKYVSLCSDGDDCVTSMKNVYFANISLKTSVGQINNWIKKQNSIINDTYKKTLSTNLNDNVCNNVKSKFKYRNYNINIFTDYINKEYVSLAVRKVTIDLCTNKTLSDKFDVLLYDKKSRKVISSTNLLKNLNMNKKDIHKRIKDSEFGASLKENIDKISWQLYYDKDRKVLIHFYHPIDKNYYDINLEDINKK